MQGTQSKQAEALYTGIVEYFSGISGVDITQAQLDSRNKLLSNGGIVCSDEMDNQILSLQEKYLAALDSEKFDEVKIIIEEVINLLI